MTDLKTGAKKATIRAETTAEEGKEKGRSWLARLFGRGKVCVCVFVCVLCVKGRGRGAAQQSTTHLCQSSNLLLEALLQNDWHRLLVS